MFELTIPGRSKLEIEYLVCDFNGTLAVDGQLRSGVPDALNAAAQLVDVHVITADTFGLAREALANVNCTLRILQPGRHARVKRRYVQNLGAARTVALGNGRNDRYMLAAAAIGIAVMLDEGTAAATIAAADILVPNILAALTYFQEPRRLTATLRE